MNDDEFQAFLKSMRNEAAMILAGIPLPPVNDSATIGFAVLPPLPSSPSWSAAASITYRVDLS